MHHIDEDKKKAGEYKRIFNFLKEGLLHEKKSAGDWLPISIRNSLSVKGSLKKSRSSRVIPFCKSDAFTVLQVPHRFHV